MQLPREKVWDIARGKWPALLRAIVPTLPETALNGKNCPCPMCGGDDRFRFTDFRQDGSYVCNQCGSGTGLDLLRKLSGMSFAEAAKAVEDRVGDVKREYKRAASPAKFDTAKLVAETWLSARRLEQGDPVTTYMRRRGIHLDVLPTMLRHHPRLRFAEDTDGGGRSVSHHPAMVSMFVGPDAKQRTLHQTYLTIDGAKAAVAKQKKWAPGGVPLGGAVRLMPSAETMGIAEGIETALSASKLHGVPVWAACDATRLMQWEPPATVKAVIVFGDNDQHFKGQVAAYTLANRLRSNKARGLTVEVRIPEFVDTDWNDMLETESR
jgi:putative DNA primase/helicase